LSIFLWFTASNYPFGIFKHFLFTWIHPCILFVGSVLHIFLVICVIVFVLFVFVLCLLSNFACVSGLKCKKILNVLSLKPLSKSNDNYEYNLIFKFYHGNSDQTNILKQSFTKPSIVHWDSNSIYACSLVVNVTINKC
jgi:hypothetical protein